MNHTLYKYISSAVVFAIWLWLAIRGIKEYIRLMKAQGIKPFMSRRELSDVPGTETAQSIQRWRQQARRLFLIWVITAISFIIISMLIDKTIGFKES